MKSQIIASPEKISYPQLEMPEEKTISTETGTMTGTVSSPKVYTTRSQSGHPPKPLNRLDTSWTQPGKGDVVALFPGPTQLSVACSTEKRGEPGIFSHVSDITTNEKLMNVGGLNDNGVIAHVLVPAKTVREFVCFIPCKVYVFADS